LDSGDNDDDESIKVIDNKRSCVERREQYLLFEAIVELRKTASEGNEATNCDSLRFNSGDASIKDVFVGGSVKRFNTRHLTLMGMYNTRNSEWFSPTWVSSKFYGSTSISFI